MQRLSQPLHRWLDDILGGPVPEEERATCSHCAMCDYGDSSAPESPFRPDLKCCTFQPELPNFLVGEIFRTTSTSAAAIEVVRGRIGGRVNVDPTGIFPTPGYRALFQSGLADSRTFGREKSIRCPYFEPNHGTCGIWAHRESVCATFFCRHNRGRVGQEFWARARDLLKALERVVRAWCVERIDPELVPPTPGPSSLPYAKRWGRWVGREEEFFSECASIASSLSGTELLGMAGPNVRAAVRGVADAKTRLISTEVPKRVKRGERHVIQIGPRDHHCRVRHVPEGLDYIDVPIAVLTRIVDAVATNSESNEACPTPLDESTMRRLLDFGVLEERNDTG